MKLTKLYAGCYRLSAHLAWTAFGHIRRNGQLWEAEIRDTETGNLRRPAGLWATRAAAAQECCDLLNRDFKRAK